MYIPEEDYQAKVKARKQSFMKFQFLMGRAAGHIVAVEKAKKKLLSKVSKLRGITLPNSVATSKIREALNESVEPPKVKTVKNNQEDDVAWTRKFRAARQLESELSTRPSTDYDTDGDRRTFTPFLSEAQDDIPEKPAKKKKKKKESTKKRKSKKAAKVDLSDDESEHEEDIEEVAPNDQKSETEQIKPEKKAKSVKKKKEKVEKEPIVAPVKPMVIKKAVEKPVSNRKASKNTMATPESSSSAVAEESQDKSELKEETKPQSDEPLVESTTDIVNLQKRDAEEKARLLQQYKQNQMAMALLKKPDQPVIEKPRVIQPAVPAVNNNSQSSKSVKPVPKKEEVKPQKITKARQLPPLVHPSALEKANHRTIKNVTPVQIKPESPPFKVLKSMETKVDAQTVSWAVFDNARRKTGIFASFAASNYTRLCDKTPVCFFQILLIA